MTSIFRSSRSLKGGFKMLGSMIQRQTKACGAFALATLMLTAGQAMAQDDASIQSIGVTDAGGEIVLEISATARPNCVDFTTVDPPALMISCTEMTLGSQEPVQTIGNGVIEQLELNESSDAEGTNTQIKVVLTSLLEYTKAVQDNKLIITIRKSGESDSGSSDAIAAALEDDGGTDAGTTTASSADLRIESTRTGELSSVAGDHTYRGAGNQIRGIDFQNVIADRVSRVVITGAGALDFTTSYPTDTKMVIALRDSVLGSGLERTLDTTKFASAVDSVSSFRSRTQRGDVKVVVNLREAVRPTVQESGSVLIIDFPIPPSIAGAAYTAPETVETYEEPEPEPELTQEDRIESAIGRERLISTGGKSIDPAKKAKQRRDSIFGAEGMFLGEIDPSHQWRGRPVNLDFVRANIHNVFRIISHVGKVNIVTSDDVDGDVTVRLIEVPWDQALAAILQAKSLGAVQYGNIVRVAPIETIRKEREDAAAAKQSQIDSMDLNLLSLPLNYANANAVQKQLENMLSKRGSVNFDSRTNTLIVRDIDPNLNQIRELVRTLDTRTPQVLIEARIVEASQTMTRALGIQWGGSLNFSAATGAPTGLFFPNTIGLSGGRTSSTVSGNSQTIGGRPANFTDQPNYVVDLPSPSQQGSVGLSLGSLTGLVNLDARLTAGESAGNGKIVASPSITTVTNQQASITDGARIPYETASLRGTNVQFVEATLQLTVTPQITADRTIFLEIAVTKNQPDFGATVQNFPTIQIKEAQTTVMVQDGDTTVIGGVYTYEEAISKTYIPGLGRIPVLGWLFKTTAKRMDRKELLVFITPTIVEGAR